MSDLQDPRTPRRLKLSQPLSPEEVSQAWEFLVSLPELNPLNPEQNLPPPPDNLAQLTDSDWFLLSNLLAREELLKSSSPVH